MKARKERVTVLFTLEEREEIANVADAVGLKISTYLRLKALEAARATNT